MVDKQEQPEKNTKTLFCLLFTMIITIIVVNELVEFKTELKFFSNCLKYGEHQYEQTRIQCKPIDKEILK